MGAALPILRQPTETEDNEHPYGHRIACSLHSSFGKQPSEPLRADSISIYYSDETQPEKCDEGMTIEEFLSESTAPRFPDAYSQPYDSLVVALKERRARAAFDDFFDEFINIESVPCDDSRQLPDSVYEARLRMILSPIHMPYNEVVKAVHHHIHHPQNFRLEKLSSGTLPNTTSP